MRSLDYGALVVDIDRIRITADRAGLLGGLLASLTCGGAGAADQLEALAQTVRSQATNGGQAASRTWTKKRHGNETESL